MNKYSNIKPDGVYIIAEAGVNHNGSLEMAKEMVVEAKKAGADVIKFQTFHNPLISHLELSYEEFRELKDFCDIEEIKFLSTAFDIDSANFLKSIGMDIWKMASGEITNYPLLVHIAKFNQPIILSTGMADYDEIDEAIKLIREYNDKELIVLHCTTAYPTPYEDVNLKVMIEIKKKFNVPIGYSDHTLGIEVPIAATALGAVVIEKHFTLDREMEGPDHKASIETDELKNMVDSIRIVESSLGDGILKLSKTEKKNKPMVRKSIFAKTDIKKGEVFTEKNIFTKRPGTGISSMEWPNIIGSVAKKEYKKGDFI